jgi:hypothetical protein
MNVANGTSLCIIWCQERWVFDSALNELRLLRPVILQLRDRLYCDITIFKFKD